MKRHILLTLTAAVILSVFLCNTFVYANESYDVQFSAELISDGKLLPVTTRIPSRVQPSAVNATLYNTLYNGMIQIKTQINLSSFNLSITNNDDIEHLRNTYSAVINENPGLFYISPIYSVSYNTSTGHIAELKPKYLENAKENKAVFEKKTAEILSKTIKKGMTDREILLSLHDYIVRESDYNYGEQTIDDHTAYGIIVKKFGVCQSYSLAYNYLLSLVGIESKFCTSEYILDENGNIIGGMGHGWSVVKLDGKWYHIDITWDDPNFENEELNGKGMVIHDFFLLSDNSLANSPNGKHYDWVTDVECSDSSYENSMPYNQNETAHVDTAYEGHYIGYYPWHCFIYNEKDGLFYSYLEPDTLKAYFKTSFDGSNFEYITKDEYTAAAELPSGISAYVPISLTDKRMTFADKNNIENTFITFENNTDSISNGKLIIAAYDTNGKLISCTIKEISLPANASEAINISLSNNSKITNYKIMLWDTENLTDIMIKPIDF